ncbi:MAG: hypothetical protein WCD18_25355 [Thermosynechococcaceae cyanobacterium]
MIALWMQQQGYGSVGFGDLLRAALPTSCRSFDSIHAIAGNADILVTNNLKDFRNAELAFPQLKILSPVDCIRS